VSAPGSSLVTARLSQLDRWQRRNGVVGPVWATARKFGDDDGNLLVVALGWYGFTAVYPLLLVAVSVLGFVGGPSLGAGLVRTLHEFPLIGSQLSPAHSSLHGSALAVAIGLVGLLYGAQGVTQTAELACSRAWDRPVPPLASRLVRSLGGLAVIGAAFLVNAVLGTLAAGLGAGIVRHVLPVAALVAVNVAGYLVAFRVLTPPGPTLSQLVPGAAVAAVGFTFLTTLGAGLVQHQLRHAGSTYGAVGATVGMVAFLLLVAKLTVFAVELNPVLARRLWPRALPSGAPTALDRQADAASVRAAAGDRSAA
jgi:uncharacterized BrkB/YihY/UPF0761 family membrane protein